MQIERVTVGFGSTINLGNFNSARFEVEFEARLDLDENGPDVAAALHELAKAEVKRQAVGIKKRAAEGE